MNVASGRVLLDVEAFEDEPCEPCRAKDDAVLQQVFEGEQPQPVSPVWQDEFVLSGDLHCAPTDCQRKFARFS